ncbi:uncharacterized protein LOC130770012 [Actinidia eriantha]|uniref:uncharacterized protein LOC130770012 n=1 Tax=Actinidia eriantha TaxID=165200 RepID=UPI00258AE523|nr:uncharacterized protein LOC130770012 [Actinidia eriantha]
MPCLNMGKRLQPAKKAWKNFTRKLHSELHKLNRSKTIKEPTKQLKPTSTAVPWPSFAFQPRLQRRRRTIQTTHILHRYHLQKRPPPVYIDQLLIEPVSVVAEHNQPPGPVAIQKGVVKEKTSSTEEAKLTDQMVDDGPGTNEEVGEAQEMMSAAADDMWESIGLASPVMHGIDERAEEFITRIRAEMQLQETMARRLMLGIDKRAEEFITRIRAEM